MNFILPNYNETINKMSSKLESLISDQFSKHNEIILILLGGSCARNDGIEIQDIDIKIILDGDSKVNEEHYFIDEVLVDLSYTSNSEIIDKHQLAIDPYRSGFYVDAFVIYDRDRIWDEYKKEFLIEYHKPDNLRKRIDNRLQAVNRLYGEILTAKEQNDDIGVTILFSSYVWTLCDTILVKNMESPSWIRGLQKIGFIDKFIMDKIVEAEGHKSLPLSEIIKLKTLYKCLWKGDFWDFLLNEITWLVCNGYELQGFHSLYVCIMMGIHNSEDKTQLIMDWRLIAGGFKILPHKSISEFIDFHQYMIEYLG